MKPIKEIQWSLNKITKCIVVDVPVLKTYSHNEMVEDLNNLQDLINEYKKLEKTFDIAYEKIKDYLDKKYMNDMNSFMEWIKEKAK